MSAEPADNPTEPLSGDAIADDNALALAYQPRRVWAAFISTGWNLAWAAMFVLTPAARHVLEWLVRDAGPRAAGPLFLIVSFGLYAVVNYPLDLWIGYLGERQFALAKDGIRAWTRDWLAGMCQQGLMFVVGACLIYLIQGAFPATWLIWISLAMLALFLLSGWMMDRLTPPGLFQFEPAGEPTTARLRQLAGPHASDLPAIVIFSARNLRDFSGGLVGMGRRQRLLLSRSTIDLASDPLLRFIVLHEIGHRRFHHILLSTLAGWAWTVIGLAACDAVIHLATTHDMTGSALYVPWLALTFTAWMAGGQPLLAYLGRRLEYQADRFYLRSGGSVDEMRQALHELSDRNLARTDHQSRRQGMFHPLPAVARRIRAAQLQAHREQLGGE